MEALELAPMEKDKESKYADHGVRKYDDEIGRFTSIDPLWLLSYGQARMLHCFQMEALELAPMEKDKESNYADHGVRKYDDEIGRFTSIDPFIRASPYASLFSNGSIGACSNEKRQRKQIRRPRRPQIR